MIARAEKFYFHDFRATRAAVIEKYSAGGQSGFSGWRWLDITTHALNSIMEVSNTALGLAIVHVQAQVATARGDVYLVLALTLLSIVLAVSATAYVIGYVIRPLGEITGAMARVAAGNLHTTIPGEARNDEIGKFAQALRYFRDGVLERRRLTDELTRKQVAQEKAEAASRIKSEFLANMSYELRTPLNAVLGYSELLSHGIGGDITQKQDEYLRYIHQSGEHLLQLITDILDLSKIEAGQFVLHDEMAEIGPLIEECVLMVRQRAAEKGLRIATLPVQALPVLRMDPLRIKQVILNLLSNAIKFTDQGSVSIATHFDDETGLALIVSDTGIGMTAEEAQLALQPFGQVEDAYSRNHDGTGLGLPIARHLVELHGGSLTIASAPRCGTVVTVTLPRERALAPAPVRFATA